MSGLQLSRNDKDQNNHHIHRYTQRCSLFTLVIILIGWFSISGLVYADSATELAEKFQQADQITLIKINRVGYLVSPPVSAIANIVNQNKKGIWVAEGVSYTGIALRHWKKLQEGVLQNEFSINTQVEAYTFRVNYNHCVEELSQGEQYVIFSQQNEQGQQQVYRCDDMIKVEEAQYLMAQLDSMQNQMFVNN